MRHIKLFEKFEDVEEVEDYFIELLDHKNDKLPITVEVTRHKVNKSKGKIKGFNRTKKFQGIHGYKICILFDQYDQLYVKKETEVAIKRLERDYNIHYNQISKRGNGNNFKEVPHGTNRVAYVSDPIWKQTITITPKNIKESFSEDFEDIIMAYMEEDDIFDIFGPNTTDVLFNIHNNKIVEDPGPFRIGDYKLYYPSHNRNISINSGNIVLRSKRIVIDTQQMLSTEFIKNKFNKIISLYPNILIYGKHALTHKKNEKTYHRCYLIFINY